MNATLSVAPIVLVHGLFGFNQLTLGGLNLADYFRHIPEALRQEGHYVPVPPQLNPSGSIENRAENLKRYLNTHPEVVGKKVHLIAHSMGGLDCRYMISKLGMAERVISLTTIATPHHGSPIADLVTDHVDPLLNQFVQSLGVDVHGIADLRTAFLQDFNHEVKDIETVRYYAFAGHYEPPPLLKLISLLGLTHDYIAKLEGDNDGLVSVNSARFGEKPANWTYLGTCEANHFRLLNWGTNIILTPHELQDDSIVEKYRELAKRIV